MGAAQPSMMRAVVFDLTIRYESEESFVEIAREWLDHGSAMLVPDWRRMLREQENIGEDDSTEKIDCRLSSVGPEAGFIAYSSEAFWSDLRGLLRVGGPLFLLELGHDDYGLGLEVRRHGIDAGYLQLQMATDFRIDEPSELKDRFDDRVRLFRRFAGFEGVQFGHVSYASQNYSTTLERGLRRTPEESINDLDRYARGYSWITVLSPTLTQRAGGTEHLRDTGAFYEVAELAGGAVWLQATESWPGYDSRHVAEIFEALASILPPGLPRTPSRQRLLPEQYPEFLLALNDPGSIGEGK